MGGYSLFGASQVALATIEKASPTLAPGRVEVTIGTGLGSPHGNSNGDINTIDCDGRADVAYRKALRLLSTEYGGVIKFGPGHFHWDKPGHTQFPNIDVVNVGGGVIHHAYSDEVYGGLYRIAHDRCSFRAGRVMVERQVDNQVMILAAAPAALGTLRDATVEDVQFEVMTAMNTSAPTTGIHFIYVMRKWGIRNRFIPHKGFDCIRSTLGNRGFFNFNSIQNDDYGNVSSAGFFPTFRPLHGGIWVEGDEWGQTIGNEMFAVGDPLDGGAEYLLRHSRGTFPPGTETGHYPVALNTIEMCPAKRGVQCWGGYSLNYVGNLFGFPWDFCDTDGDGYIHITGAGGTAAGEEASGVSFYANELHNLAKNDTDAAFLFAEKCDTLYIGPNKWDICFARYPLQIVAETCRRAAINPGVFQARGGGSPKSRAPILIRKAVGNAGAAVIQNGMVIGAPFSWNNFNGFSDGVSTPVNGHGYHSLHTGGTLNGRGLNNIDTGAAPASGVATDKLSVGCKIG